MKKTRLISIVLILAILLSSIVVLAEEASEIEKENIVTRAIDEEDKEYGDEDKKKAEDYGTKLGEIDGQVDLKKELVSKWERNLPTDGEIIKKYDLEVESEDYQKKFIDDFKKAYEKAYLKAYEQVKEPEKVEATSSGFGAAFGMIYGEMAGIRDYQENNRFSLRRAMPSRSRIESIFYLRDLPYGERDTFIEQFEINFEKVYENAYYTAKFGSKKNSLDSGRADGIFFGDRLGRVFGAKDYFEHRNSNFKRNMPTNSQIAQDYSLKTDNQAYIDGFINGFRNAYEDSYINGFRNSRNEINILEDSKITENKEFEGLTVGKSEGKIQASLDHMSKKTNDWERSQPLSSTIILEHNLMYQTIKYRDKFISAYWEGYALAYTDTYKQISLDDSMSKKTSETIPIAGGILESLVGGFAVEIDSGVYYKPVILTIDNLSENYSVAKRYISASNFYRVSMVNPSGAFAKDKKVKISFEYYGDKDGGIYMLDGGKWHYLASTIEEGIISAYVNPATISANGNVFGVLIDKETQVFYDIRGHWAKDEITTYIRNGVINGYPDKTFKPDQLITRAEFLVLLSRLYEWYMPYDTDNTKFFKDYETFNRFSIKHISHGLYTGYIIGYPDKYFRPYNNISYKEVDLIMRRVLKDPSFKWSKYAEKMMYDESIRSKSYDSYDNNITRAEFSYMLYNLEQCKY